VDLRKKNIDEISHCMFRHSKILAVRLVSFCFFFQSHHRSEHVKDTPEVTLSAIKEDRAVKKILSYWFGKIRSDSFKF